MIIKFYNLNNTPDNIILPDIYFTCEYGKACEYSDNAIWELCQYKDLIYIYLKKKYIFEKKTYYDLITPYGYSGFYFEKQETYDEFIPLFRYESIKKNYITEVIGQCPYINIKITNYDRIISKNTMGIKISNYKNLDEYLNATHKDNRRGYNIGLKNKLSIKWEYFNEENLQKFKIVYEHTMNNLNSVQYYYFNENYYKSLIDLKENIKFVNIYKDYILIASFIIFKYKNFLHYHLGGSLHEYRYLRPNNFLHCNVIKYGIENNYNLYHLGGGLKDNDTLFDFKNKISNIKFNYTIYKNILNKEVYECIKNSLNENNENFPIHRS